MIAVMRGRRPEPESRVVQFKTDDGVPPDQRAANDAARLRPQNLCPDEAAIWDRIAPELALLGRLKGHFVDVVAEYVRAVNRMRVLRETLMDEGEVYTVHGRNGSQHKSRPEVAQLNETWRQWRQLAAALGLTPADERGLALGQSDLFDNPFADLENA